LDFAALHKTSSTAKKSTKTSPQRPSGEGDSPDLREILKGMRPWIKFMMSLGYITGGVGVLIGFLALGLGIYKFNMSKVQMGVALLVGPALFCGVAYALMRYDAKIHAFIANNKPEDLEAAMLSQKSVWKLASLLLGVSLVAYIILLAVIQFFGLAK
jgi:hypothetical protein